MKVAFFNDAVSTATSVAAVAVVDVVAVTFSMKLHFAVINDAAIAIVNLAAVVIVDAVVNAVAVVNVHAVAAINDATVMVLKFCCSCICQ